MSANLTTWADGFGFAPKGRWEKEEEERNLGRSTRRGEEDEDEGK